ncbi:MAG TPA: ADOP family duplicated permease, partial [Bryobacterales bacterium]|nr:ADOP family duplicated permease [Bryobacterales bacterium]
NSAHLLGRLKPGVTEAQAEADLHPIFEDLQKQQPAQFPEVWRISLIDLEESFPSGLRQTLWILFAAVGLLLLIACANVSNLLLSRAASRQKEMAVRASLGAGRLRLIRQLLTESLLLALAAAALGVPLASFGLRAIIALVPIGTIPDESVIALNTPVLLFTVGVAVFTALLFGLAPALHASTADLAGALQASGRSSTGTRRQAWLRDSLVVIEVALSLMLLVGAGLMIRTLLALENVSFGFRPERMLTMRVPLSDQRYPDPARRTAFFQELLSRISALPGVVAAGLGRGMHPIFELQYPVEVPGSAQQDSRFVLVHEVNPDYPKAYGLSPFQGRFFTESETAARRHLAFVNQAFVRRYFPTGDSIGRMVRIPQLRRSTPTLTDASFQITGIIRDIANYDATSEVRPEIYIPYTITALANRLIVLARSSPASVLSDIRRQVYAIDPDQPVTGVLTMEEIIREYAYARPRFNLVLFTVFAVIGLALASIGVYGVISNSVAQRTHEIGIRIALGASFTDIAGMVLGRGLKLLIIGIALGLAGSFSTARFLAQQIWNVSPFDPVSFTLVSLLLLLIGLQACFWPARRAARTDPTIALRYE